MAGQSTWDVTQLEQRQLGILDRIQRLASRITLLKGDLPERAGAGTGTASGEDSNPAQSLPCQDTSSLPLSCPEAPRAEAGTIDADAPELLPAVGDGGASSAAGGVQERLSGELRDLGIADFAFMRVARDYYDWPLEQRRAALEAPSTAHLCKSIVLKNTQAPATVTDCSNPKNSLYYVVVVQYEAKLNTEKVRAFVHALSEGALPKKRYNMRLAPEDEANKLTGFVYNAVTPVGMATKVPIILSHLIAELEPKFFWMGGGEVDLKLRVGVADFVEKYNPFIADCT